MTTPTQLPIPSNNLLDSRFNFEKLDQIVNSDANYYVDRFGKQRLTAKGLEDLVSRIQSEFQNDIQAIDGFRVVGQVGSFADLRSAVPSYEGQSILLRAHPVGWAAMSHGPVGGGEFIARKGAAVDDGGYICVPTGQTEYYWQRIPKKTR